MVTSRQSIGIVIAHSISVWPACWRTVLKDHYSKNIRKMIITRVFFLPFLVLLLVYGTIIFFFASYSSHQVKNELVRIATDHRNLIDQFLVEKAGMLKFIANAFSRNILSEQSNLENIFKKLQLEICGLA